VLRAFVSEHGRPPQQSDQRGIMLAQAAREAAIIADSKARWVIADPAPLMTAIYSIVYFQDDSLVPEGLAWARNYAALVWCAPDFAWVSDAGQRDGPQARQDVHLTLERIVRSQMSGLPVVRVSGSITERVGRTLAALTGT